MRNDTERFEKAIAAFDAYHARDPVFEEADGRQWPRELLYAHRMTARLNAFAPNADEVLQLAARCQHIGRWEIPREQYSPDRKGYLQWRSAEKMHHASLATDILRDCGYDEDTIGYVRKLVMKKELSSDARSQLLEDVACLVFIEHYLEDFAHRQSEEKVVDIIGKTLKKMSVAARTSASALTPPAMQNLISRAVASER